MQPNQQTTRLLLEIGFAIGFLLLVATVPAVLLIGGTDAFADEPSGGSPTTFITILVCFIGILVMSGTSALASKEEIKLRLRDLAIKVAIVLFIVGVVGGYSWLVLPVFQHPRGLMYAALAGIVVGFLTSLEPTHNVFQRRVRRDGTPLSDWKQVGTVRFGWELGSVVVVSIVFALVAIGIYAVTLRVQE
jgi:hypothetical protein